MTRLERSLTAKLERRDDYIKWLKAEVTTLRKMVGYMNERERDAYYALCHIVKDYRRKLAR